jgi:hypothetical protein
MTFRSTLIAALGWLLAGCAIGLGPTIQEPIFCQKTAIDDQQVERLLALASVATADNINYLAIKTPEATELRDGTVVQPGLPNITLTIGTTAPVVRTTGGPGWATGLSLHELKVKPKRIVIRQGASGVAPLTADCLLPGPHIIKRGVLLVAQFLDASKKPIGAVTSGSVARHGNFGVTSFKVPDEAMYVLLTVDPSRLGTQFTLPGLPYVELICAANGICVPIFKDGTFTGRASATGQVSVTVLSDA